MAQKRGRKRKVRGGRSDDIKMRVSTEEKGLYHYLKEYHGLDSLADLFTKLALEEVKRKKIKLVKEQPSLFNQNTTKNK